MADGAVFHETDEERGAPVPIFVTWTERFIRGALSLGIHFFVAAGQEKKR